MRKREAADTGTFQKFLFIFTLIQAACFRFILGFSFNKEGFLIIWLVAGLGLMLIAWRGWQNAALRLLLRFVIVAAAAILLIIVFVGTGIYAADSASSSETVWGGFGVFGLILVFSLSTILPGLSLAAAKGYPFDKKLLYILQGIILLFFGFIAFCAPGNLFSDYIDELAKNLFEAGKGRVILLDIELFIRILLFAFTLAAMLSVIAAYPANIGWLNKILIKLKISAPDLNGDTDE